MNDSPEEVIAHIAKAAEVLASQAGVGAMETAGSIVSYLAEHPEQIDDFVAGITTPIDWPGTWIEHGCLSWHGMDGKIHRPEEVRRHRIIRDLEKGGRP